MSTQVGVLVGAIVTLLEAANTGADVYRARVIPFARDELPAINIKPDEELTEHLGPFDDMASFTLNMEIEARGEAVDALVDGILAPAHVAIMKDPTLGNQCAQILYERRQWEFADGDNTAGKLLVTYKILYMLRTRTLGLAG